MNYGFLKFLFHWGWLGFVALWVVFVAATNLYIGGKTKQLVFLLLTCGPVGWIILIAWQIAALYMRIWRALA